MSKDKTEKIIKVLIVLSMTGFLFCWSRALAHSGRTNSSGCHNDNIHGGYHCHNGGSTGSTGYSTPTCTFNGTKYNSAISAWFEYNRKLREAIDNVYLRDLERNPTSGDYELWKNKLNAGADQMTTCKWSGFSEADIHNEIIKSEEYAHIQWLNSHKSNIRQAYVQILGRTATEQEVAKLADIEPDIEIIKAYLKTTDEYQKKNNWLVFYANKYKWWLVGILAYLLFAGIQYLNEQKPKK